MDAIKEFLIAYLPAILSLAGAIITIYRVKPEVKKIKSETNKNDNEALSAIGEAAESIANGAKITVEQLHLEITQMQKREIDRDAREEALKRELKEVKQSLNDWQDWASRLVFQIRSHGLEPVAFKPSPAPPHKPKTD